MSDTLVSTDIAGGSRSVAVTTASTKVLDVNPGRRRLSFQNTGTGVITLHFGSGPAVAGAGIVLDPAAGTARQGGAWEEPVNSGLVWKGTVYVIASAATTLTIVEG